MSNRKFKTTRRHEFDRLTDFDQAIPKLVEVPKRSVEKRESKEQAERAKDLTPEEESSAMSEPPNKPKRSVRAAVAASLLLVATVGAVLWWASGKGVTSKNGNRIDVGMSKKEVESILGTPNPLPDLRRKHEAFWDADALMGFQYVAVSVQYDAEGKVKSKTVKTARRWPPSWWPWR